MTIGQGITYIVIALIIEYGLTNVGNGLHHLGKFIYDGLNEIAKNIKEKTK